MRRLLLAAMVLLASVTSGQAEAGPKGKLKVVKVTCVFGDGRTHLLAPRATEADSDDPLICQVELGGVSEATAADLVGELRVVRGKQEQVLVAGDLEPREDRYRRASVELVAPHDTWFEAIDWAPNRAPKLHLVVAVLQRSDTLPRERWKRVLASRLDVGHRRVYAGTPSLKSSQQSRPGHILRPPVTLTRAARRTPPARAGATPTTVVPAGDPYSESP